MRYVTELLNVCYIFINTLDIMKKNNKIVISRKGKFMRIIGGKARGTKLYTLEGNNTRPTLDRVKESLFNIIQNYIQDSVFLDLFAGSGAIGLEAVSRGAKKSILCDNSKEAIDIIKQNIKKTKLEEKIELYRLPYDRVLTQQINEKIDIIYIDPPYETNFACEAVKIILEKELINQESIVIIETDREEEIEKNLEELSIEIVSKRKYGRIHLIFLKKEEKV